MRVEPVFMAAIRLPQTYWLRTYQFTQIRSFGGHESEMSPTRLKARGQLSCLFRRLQRQSHPVPLLASGGCRVTVGDLWPAAASHDLSFPLSHPLLTLTLLLPS